MRNPAKRRPARTVRVPSQPIAGVQGTEGRTGAKAGLELTCTVRVSETFPLAGKLAAVGLNVHAVPLGAFKHWKLTLPVAPLWELRPMVKLADCPTESVVEPGVMLPVKPGADSISSAALYWCVRLPMAADTVRV
jgi:hypothetical protein